MGRKVGDLGRNVGDLGRKVVDWGPPLRVRLHKQGVLVQGSSLERLCGGYCFRSGRVVLKVQ